MLVQYGGMLDQCSTRVVTCSSIAIPGLRDAVLVHDMFGVATEMLNMQQRQDSTVW